MTQEDQGVPETLSDDEKEKLDRRIRGLGVAYRFLIVLGLVLLVGFVLLLALTPFLSRWSLLVPVGLILLGVLLAAQEYRLFRMSRD